MNRQNVVEALSNGLRRERLAYKIFGIVALVLAVIIIVAGIVGVVAGGFITGVESEAANEIYSYNENGIDIEITDGDIAAVTGIGVAFFSGFYLGFGFSLLAIAIVNLVLAAKVGKCRLSDDATIRHAGSVGSIIFAAFFNEIALIFVIFNFVKAKKHRALLAG
ncbi:MAG: hypothetical protein IJF19_04090 [Clostridia bacterium]|nr:hypothetical protein [Clostridia bacterium]